MNGQIRSEAGVLTDYEARIRRNRARRNRELRRRLTGGISALTACLFFLIFGLNGVMSDAKEQGMPQMYKYYRSVVVLPRDTVETIADVRLSEEERAGIADRASYAAEIRSINHLSAGEEPLAGTMLVVPYYSAERAE